MVELVVIDVETTGLHPATDRILEVAVVRADAEGHVLKRFETLLNPERDVGPTDIHGITAGDIVGAPRFPQVAGTIFRLLADAVIVGHNVRFDLTFLSREALRVGWTLPPASWVDTMSLADLAGLAEGGRSLEACCVAAGVARSVEHRALADAEAALALLLQCLRVAPEQVRPRVHSISGVPLDLWPISDTTAMPVCRATAARLSDRRRTYLGSLVARLPGEMSCEESDGVSAYFALLDRVLEDRRITEDEADALFALATDWGLSRRDVERAHHTYLDALICAALRDRVVSEAEREDLLLAAGLLGISEEKAERQLEAARAAVERTSLPPPVPAAAPPARAGELVGKKVCFTGACQCSIRGEAITRARAEEIAEAAGLQIAKGVTRTTDILVVADPETMSGKAKKAREYGIRVVAEAVFWGEIGVRVD